VVVLRHRRRHLGRTLFINLGTEIVGIVITVAVAVGNDDSLPDFTEGLLLNIGTRSRRVLNNDSEAISSLPSFMSGLEYLARLSAIRDGKAPTPPGKVGDILDEGTRKLPMSLGKPTERRHFGGGGPLARKTVGPSRGT
jgi:hypothetical protein